MLSIPIRSALLLVAIVSMAGTPYTVLMTAIAKEVLHGGPNTLGLLMTATGVGALSGALYLAQRESVVGLGRIIMWASVVFGVGLVIFSQMASLWPAFVVLAFAGCGFMIHLAATNTILQTIVEERLRGRVMSFYTMAFFGTVPIGSLLGGVIADRYGAMPTVFVTGVVCLAGSAWFAYKLPAIRAVVRPIYRERGIITGPAVDAGGETLEQIPSSKCQPANSKLQIPSCKSQMTQRMALVVGAGIGGLAAAVALKRAGWQVR